ncbi:MAG: hypothetical protein L0Y68_06380 [Candidatus Dadabacteria bacterium]|nr:hypothetical protein [Candidatus Dadabacteria bacterium]
MAMRILKLSVVLILLFYLVTCGGGGGGARDASINLFIQLPEEFFTDSTTELSSEQVIRQLIFQGLIVALMVSGDDFQPPINEIIPVSTDGPTRATIFVPAGMNRLFEAKIFDENDILVAICSAFEDIFFGEENDVVLPCSPFACTDCSNPICEGERCDFEDETKVCVNGQCVTPTPPPTPTPSPTPRPTPTPTPTATPTPTPPVFFGCCEISQQESCFESSNIQCAQAGGDFVAGGFCTEGGVCSAAPPTPTPSPTPTPTPTPSPTPEPEVCCDFGEGCATIPASECGSEVFCSAPCGEFCCSPPPTPTPTPSPTPEPEGCCQFDEGCAITTESECNGTFNLGKSCDLESGECFFSF